MFTANAINEGKEILEHRTTVTLEEKEVKTKMTVQVVVTRALSGLGFALVGMEQGWRQQFDKLEKFLAKRHKFPAKSLPGGEFTRGSRI